MHPNSYLKAFWRTETTNEVFVAMSFDSKYSSRFENVFKKAIEDQPIENCVLKGFRVDNSKTGDSILTEIMNRIAHSKLVLADISVIDEGRFSGEPIRNGNVMYELGMALACRQPSEVLIVKDDTKKSLFDVSTIPFISLDFINEATAIKEIRKCLSDRLRETNLIRDARIQITADTLNSDELFVLKDLGTLQPNESRDYTHPELKILSLPIARGIDGLLKKGCLKATAINKDTDGMFYQLSTFGRALLIHANTYLKPVTGSPARSTIPETKK